MNPSQQAHDSESLFLLSSGFPVCSFIVGQSGEEKKYALFYYPGYREVTWPAGIQQAGFFYPLFLSFVVY